MIMRIGIMRPTVVALLSLAVGVYGSVAAQDVSPIWAGVYTAAQAERGRAVVQTHCSECHAEDLSGGEGPALSGSTFMLKWETLTVERLFHKIRDTMPSVGSTDVTLEEKLDSVAFILQQNGFPAGMSELADAPGTLAAIKMVPKDGVATPRAGALVQAIGCLEQSAGNQWTITRSTSPQITTLDPMSASDKSSAAALPQGSATIQLLSVFPSPAPLKGHKILVKGLLIKAPSGDRINVTQLESLAPACAP
jgi:mono/diheme cytochrome c family protein